MRPSSSLLLPLPLLLLFLLPLSRATNFHIINNCSYTIWPAAVPGGGLELPPSHNWTFSNPATSATSGRIWARTNCTFDAAGNGSCLSGDCSGLLNCTANGSPPATLLEYSLNQYGANDFYDISLVDGFNLPADFASIGPGNCSKVLCSHNITEQCPPELRSAGGCRSACDVYKTNEYCCNNSGSGSCTPTKYSTFFKRLCPNCYTYPQDDPTSTFTCTSGGDFRVTFCP